MSSSAASCTSTRADELLVTNSTRCPRARRAATASTEPAIGCVCQPHDTIEIAQHHTGFDRIVIEGGVLMVWLVHTWPCWHARCQPVGVPRFEPFAALRYSVDHLGVERLDDVVAPPYDVLSATDIDSLLARHEHNIVAIDVPLDRDGPDRYNVAARRMATWIRDGVLVRDAAPSLTLYRMEFTDETGRRRQTVGVIGALEVVDEGADGVLPHERTTPKAKTDRLDLTRATRCNLSPVWGLSLTAGLSELLQDPGERGRQLHRRERCRARCREDRRPAPAGSDL